MTASPLPPAAGYDNRNRLTQLNRAGAETTYTYDANSNRLSAIDKTTSDTDLDGEFDDSDFSKSTGQALNIDPASNKLLGFTQTFTKVRGTRTLSILNTNVAYTLDANGALTSDGLRDFEYDEANRLAKVKIFKDGEAAKVRYLHNALGQRVFKSEPEAEQTLPNEAELGLDFISWLKSNFKWLFAAGQANTSIGTAYSYADGQLPTWALMGEYDNGSAAGKGRTEYIWLPTEDGQAIPIGIFRNGKFFAIHTDHLGTPRLMTNEDNKPVWQWPYSAFGNNKPTGVLKATPNPKAAITNQPTLLKATAATELNLRFPGQYADVETGLFYNYYRNYLASQGRYTQNDPIGLGGGINTFAYVEGNPLSYTDPTGEFVPQLIGFGIGAGLEYLTNPCASATDLLLAGGLGALGGGSSKAAFLRLGPRSLTRETGLEWSHSIARRTVNRHTSGGLNRTLNQRGGLNGSWRTPASHARHDASRHVAGVDPMPLPLRALDRIPDWLKGTALGGGVGAAVAGGECECR